MEVLGRATGIRLSEPHTAVDLGTSGGARPISHSLQPESAAGELVLHDVSAEGPPGVLFDVFIAPKSNPSARQYVGTISWFGVFGHHHGTSGPKPKTRTLRFDVTDPLRKLGAAADAAGLTVSFDASTGLVSSTPAPATGVQADASKAFRPQSQVQIGAVEIRSVTAPP